MNRTLFRLVGALALVVALACGDDATMSTGPSTGDMAPADLGADLVTVDLGDPDMPDGGANVTEMGPDQGDLDEGMCIDPDGTVGEACFRNSDCNDFCFCNGTELCRGGFCVAGDPPCEDDFACTFRACDEEANTCGNLELRNEVCDDGDLCTGDEICDALLGCVDGIPLGCSDGDSCTIDQCDPELGCLNTLRDLDGDGFPDSRCTTGLDADCRDDRPDINPGAAEVCDNFEDDDCDGQPDVFDPDCTPTNDVCATAIQVASTGFFGFGTRALLDDYETQCASSDESLDAVFFFDVLAESDLVVEIIEGPNNAVLELRGPGDLRTCEDDTRASTERVPCERSNIPSFGTPFPATIEQNRLAPGRYYLLVETEEEAVGTLNFELTRSTPPPLPDSCATAPTIIAPGGVFLEDIRLLTDQHDSPSCGSTVAQPEACYVLDLAAPQDVTIGGEFFFGSGTPGQGAIAVVDDFGRVVMSERACASGLAPELALRSLSAGVYYILVERSSSSVVSHELDVSIGSRGPLPDCDLCTNACTAPPAPTGGTARTVDLSVMLLDEPTLGCALPSGAQNDSFFTFDTTVANEEVGLEIGIAPPTAGFFAYSIDDASGVCPATSAPICRAGGVLGGPVSTTVTVPDVGTHNLAVQTNATSGDLTVEIDPMGVAGPGAAPAGRRERGGTRGGPRPPKPRGMGGAGGRG
ncbi:MAG: putative metal-binding motif-containing protein, partial [Myxococcota bacterium]